MYVFRLAPVGVDISAVGHANTLGALLVYC